MESIRVVHQVVLVSQMLLFIFEFLTCVYVCVGTVLAPCRGETPVTTATLNLSATTTAASRLSASPWPRW